MSKILYACGDSFMYGMECLGDKDKTVENKQLAFPKYLSDKLGYKYINNSVCGATNEFIFRKTILDLADFEKNGTQPQDVFVVIGITSLHRIEIDGERFYEPIENYWIEKSKDNPNFPTEYWTGKTIFCNPGSGYATTDPLGNTVDTAVLITPWCSQFLWTETVQMPQQEARMIALHELLKAKGYKHIFVNTVCPLLRTSCIDVNCKNFVNIDTDSFYTFANTKYPTEKRIWNHFTTIPHKEYSEILYDYINEHQLS